MAVEVEEEEVLVLMEVEVEVVLVLMEGEGEVEELELELELVEEEEEVLVLVGEGAHSSHLRKFMSAMELREGKWIIEGKDEPSQQLERPTSPQQVSPHTNSPGQGKNNKRPRIPTFLRVCSGL